MAGGSNNIARMSPRQRMINLMYIVLTAMLALNVSSDVLNGFSQVREGIQQTNQNMSARNSVQFEYLEGLYRQNPEKAGAWYAKGVELRKRAGEVYDEIEALKIEIARAADGPEGNYADIVNNDDLEASSVTMLNPTTQKGKKLRGNIDSFREYVVSLIGDSTKKASVREMLSTKAGSSRGTVTPLSWEQKMFENMPAIAAVTLLTKMQNDIRQAEAEALGNLITNVDIGDVRVNELNAYVIPNSNMVMRGGKYSAHIVLAAIDTTQRPTIYVNGARLNNAGGLYEFVAGSVGTHDYSGYIEVPRGDGSTYRRPFKSSYTVIEPMATISPTMMNVLYAGIDNPISISVPGVPMSAVQATMSNGTLTRNGDLWVARASNVGGEAVISVTATVDGRPQSVGSMTFRVRKLPDPTAFLAVKDAAGNTVHYKGSPKRISKAALMGADGLGAALDDGILNITYQVVSFNTVVFDQMGNAIPEVSNGSHFSPRQREQFKRMKAGKSFFISNVKAKGPDGITRDISPMEVALN
ncbi:MAG: gliding motility protein GldM [Candidatus Amulumruptor caecigallinarius]|nr:gliding motility protein GldM [Candidatus Amulumruptor caecigallinarius]